MKCNELQGIAQNRVVFPGKSHFTPLRFSAESTEN